MRDGQVVGESGGGYMHGCEIMMDVGGATVRPWPHYRVVLWEGRGAVGE